jgi:hypothetical protein
MDLQKAFQKIKIERD